MDRNEAIEHLKVVLKTCDVQDEEAVEMAIDALTAQPEKRTEEHTETHGVCLDAISRQQAIDKFIDALEEIFSDIRERHVDDSVCGLCEYDGAYMGQSGEWCNECPGFEKDDCFKLSGKIRKEWTDEIIKALPSAQPERKKGQWIRNDNGTYSCSVCQSWIPEEQHYYAQYCLYCGAEMRGEKQAVISPKSPQSLRKCEVSRNDNTKCNRFPKTAVIKYNQRVL